MKTMYTTSIQFGSRKKNRHTVFPCETQNVVFVLLFIIVSPFHQHIPCDIVVVFGYPQLINIIYIYIMHVCLNKNHTVQKCSDTVTCRSSIFRGVFAWFQSRLKVGPLGAGVGHQHSEAVGVPNVRLEDFGVSQEADEVVVFFFVFLEELVLSDMDPDCPSQWKFRY